MRLKSYDWRNTIMEVTLGAVPMVTLLWMSNGPLDFSQKIGSYIPSHEIQLLLVCYLAFGLAFSSLNLLFNFSKVLLVPSLEFISDFISIGQAFAGFLLFGCVLAMIQKIFSFSVIFVACYYGFHIAVINLMTYQEYLKHKNKWILNHE